MKYISKIYHIITNIRDSVCFYTYIYIYIYVWKIPKTVNVLNYSINSNNVFLQTRNAGMFFFNHINLFIAWLKWGYVFFNKMKILNSRPILRPWHSYCTGKILYITLFTNMHHIFKNSCTSYTNMYFIIIHYYFGLTCKSVLSVHIPVDAHFSTQIGFDPKKMGINIIAQAPWSE